MSGKIRTGSMEKGVRESLSPEDQEYSMEMQYMMDLLIPGCWNEYLSFEMCMRKAVGTPKSELACRPKAKAFDKCLQHSMAIINTHCERELEDVFDSPSEEAVIHNNEMLLKCIDAADAQLAARRQAGLKAMDEALEKAKAKKRLEREKIKQERGLVEASPK